MNKILVFAAMLMVVSPCYGALLHHYEFVSDASDSAGSADGTLIGDAYVGSGVLNLDGFGDYVQFDTHLVPTTGNYTVAFFGTEYLRPEIFGTMISQGWSTSVYGPPEGFYIGRAHNGNLRSTDFNDTGLPFPTGRHHFAIVADAAELQSKLYVDGIIIATLEYAIESQPLGTDTRFGRQFDSSAYTEYFHGSLDDIRIYDQALTDADIAVLVPLPAAVWLFMTGLCALLGISQRLRNKRI